MAGEKQRRMQDELGRLIGADGVVGAALVTRDGICILNRDARLPNPETFSAMSAALVGAAETAMHELGDRSDVKVAVHTASDTMLAVGVDDELLLLVLVATPGPLDAALGRVEAARATIAKIAAG